MAVARSLGASQTGKILPRTGRPTNVQSIIRNVVSGSGNSDTPYGDMLAQINREQRDFYTDTYRPLTRDLVNSVNSTELVDAAKAATGTYSAERTAKRGARQLGRMGVTPNARDTSLNTYDAALGNAMLTDGTINQARVDQQNRNEAVRTDLVNISRGIASSATQSALNAAQQEQTRNMNNENISAQNKVSRNQLAGSVASMALLAVALM